MRHGSAVAWQGRAALILGASGAGKSTLALDMISKGASLVSDDQVRLWAQGGQVIAAAPEPIRDMIEVRGIGLLNAPSGPAAVALIVDLDRAEPDRLPPERRFDLLGRSFPLILGAERAHLGSALLHLLKYGRPQ